MNNKKNELKTIMETKYGKTYYEVYDENDRLINLYTVNKRGEITFQHIKSYDKKGNLIYEKEEQAFSYKKETHSKYNKTGDLIYEKYFYGTYYRVYKNGNAETKLAKIDLIEEVYTYDGNGVLIEKCVKDLSDKNPKYHYTKWVLYDENEKQIIYIKEYNSGEYYIFNEEGNCIKEGDKNTGNFYTYYYKKMKKTLYFDPAWCEICEIETDDEEYRLISKKHHKK